MDTEVNTMEEQAKVEPISLVVAIHRFFGKKEGQTLEGFAKEIRALTDKDKEEFALLLTKELGGKSCC